MTRGFEWFVGVFEGEGCIYVSSPGVTPRLTLSLAMTDEDVVREVHRITGVGTVIGPFKGGRKEGHKMQWCWRMQTRDEVVALLNRMLPLLGNRRSAKAQEALDWHAANPLKVRPKGAPPDCGTVSGAGTHRRRGEELCEPCLLAEKKYHSDWDMNQKQWREATDDLCIFPGCDKPRRNPTGNGLCQSHGSQKASGKELRPLQSRGGDRKSAKFRQMEE